MIDVFRSKFNPGVLFMARMTAAFPLDFLAGNLSERFDNIRRRRPGRIAEIIFRNGDPF